MKIEKEQRARQLEKGSEGIKKEMRGIKK